MSEFHKMTKEVGALSRCNTCQTIVIFKLDAKNKAAFHNLDSTQKHYGYDSHAEEGKKYSCNPQKDPENFDESRIGKVEKPKPKEEPKEEAIFSGKGLMLLHEINENLKTLIELQTKENSHG
jgi:hypothetical protein